MIMLKFYDIWQEEGYAKDNPLENTITWLYRECGQRGISTEVTEAIIQETFLQMESGLKFSIDKCRCGCGIDKSGTDATHYMLSQMISFNRHVAGIRTDLIERRLNSNIAGYMSRENKKYIQHKTQPSKFKEFFKPSNSPTLAKSPVWKVLRGNR